MDIENVSGTPHACSLQADVLWSHNQSAIHAVTSYALNHMQSVSAKCLSVQQITSSESVFVQTILVHWMSQNNIK